MFLVFVTLALISLGVAAFLWGAITLSRYGFRISPVVGLAVLLFPPYTFYFAFFRLEEEGKELPTASWLCGMLVSVLLSLLFLPTLQHVFRGEWDQLRDAEGPGEVAAANQNGENGEASGDEAGGEASDEKAADEGDGEMSSDTKAQASADGADEGDDAEKASNDSEDESGEGNESSGESSTDDSDSE